MLNFSQDVLKSKLWVVDAKQEDGWFAYFDWLTQFELSKKNHHQMTEDGYSLYIDKKSLLADQLLIVHFDQVSPQKFSDLWKSLGSPTTTIFNSLRDLRKYNLDSRDFLFVTDEA